MTKREVERLLPQFERLIAETARQIVAGRAELEIDDVRQLLRVKAWYAIERYDGRISLRSFVFGSIYSMRKDIEKRPRRIACSIEQLREHNSLLTDWFDAKYLSIDAEEVYWEVEDEEVTLPATLTPIERRAIALRLRGRGLLEIDRELGLSRGQRERLMRSVREKLADWAPSARVQRSAPTPPLPHAEPRPAPARAALAA